MTKLITMVLVVGGFTAALGSPPSALPTPTAAQQEVLDRLQNNADFETIGQTGNKIFIAYTPLRNAMYRGSFCTEAGLEFATLKDRSEYTFISLNYRGGVLWLSGLLRGNYDQYRADAFVWSNGEQVPQDITFYLDASQLLCVCVYPGLFTTVASCHNAQHQTLCQLQLGEVA